MRFLFFYDQQKSDEDLTGKVRGLFPRAAKEIEISILGPKVRCGEFSLDGRATRAHGKEFSREGLENYQHLGVREYEGPSKSLVIKSAYAR
jgi:hypothetical protein